MSGGKVTKKVEDLQLGNTWAAEKIKTEIKANPECTNGAGGVTAAEMPGLKIKEPHPSLDTLVGGMRGVLAASQCAPGVIQLPKTQSCCLSFVWL